MITENNILYNCAQLSKRVYEDCAHSNYGINAGIYSDKENKLVYVAFKGTSNSKDIYSDSPIFLKSKLDYQKKIANAIIKEVRETYGADVKIVTTGHSLGAVHAILAASQNDCEAFVFDTPGHMEFCKVKNKKKIKIFQSKKNPVNRESSKTLEGFHVNDLTDSITALGIEGGKFNTNYHKIDNILKAINNKFDISLDNTKTNYDTIKFKHKLFQEFPSRFNHRVGIYDGRKKNSILEPVSDMEAILLSSKDEGVFEVYKENYKILKNDLATDTEKLENEIKSLNDNSVDLDKLIEGLNESVKSVWAKYLTNNERKEQAKALYKEHKNYIEKVNSRINEYNFFLLCQKIADPITSIDFSPRVAFLSELKEQQEKLMSQFNRIEERYQMYEDIKEKAKINHNNLTKHYRNLSKNLKKISKGTLCQFYAEILLENLLPSLGASVISSLTSAERAKNMKKKEKELEKLSKSLDSNYGTYQRAATLKHEHLQMMISFIDLLGNPHTSVDEMQTLLKRNQKELDEIITERKKQIKEKKAEHDELEGKSERWKAKINNQHGKRKKRTLRELEEIEAEKNETELKLAELRHANEDDKSTRRNIVEKGVGLLVAGNQCQEVRTRTTLMLPQDKRQQDIIFEEKHLENDTLSQNDWNDIVSMCYGNSIDLVNSDLKYSRTKFIEECISESKKMGIIITEKEAGDIFDDKIKKNGQSQLIEVINHNNDVFNQVYGSQDNYAHAVMNATESTFHQLVRTGLPQKFGASPTMIGYAGKMIQVGRIGYQSYQYGRNIEHHISILRAALGKPTDKGVNLALSSLSGNFVGVAVNSIQLLGAACALWNTFSTPQDEISMLPDELQGLGRMLVSMENNLTDQLSRLDEKANMIKLDTSNIKREVQKAVSLLKSISAYMKNEDKKALASNANLANYTKGSDETYTIINSYIIKLKKQSRLKNELVKQLKTEGNTFERKKALVEKISVKNIKIEAELEQIQSKLVNSFLASPEVNNKLLSDLHESGQEVILSYPLKYVGRFNKEISSSELSHLKPIDFANLCKIQSSLYQCYELDEHKNKKSEERYHTLFETNNKYLSSIPRLIDVLSSNKTLNKLRDDMSSLLEKLNNRLTEIEERHYHELESDAKAQRMLLRERRLKVYEQTFQKYIKPTLSIPDMADNPQYNDFSFPFKQSCQIILKALQSGQYEIDALEIPLLFNGRHSLILNNMIIIEPKFSNQFPMFFPKEMIVNLEKNHPELKKLESHRCMDYFWTYGWTFYPDGHNRLYFYLNFLDYSEGRSYYIEYEQPITVFQSNDESIGLFSHLPENFDTAEGNKKALMMVDFLFKFMYGKYNTYLPLNPKRLFFGNLDATQNSNDLRFKIGLGIIQATIGAPVHIPMLIVTLPATGIRYLSNTDYIDWLEQTHFGNHSALAYYPGKIRFRGWTSLEDYQSKDFHWTGPLLGYQSLTLENTYIDPAEDAWRFWPYRSDCSILDEYLNQHVSFPVSKIINHYNQHVRQLYCQTAEQLDISCILNEYTKLYYKVAHIFCMTPNVNYNSLKDDKAFGQILKSPDEIRYTIKYDPKIIPDIYSNLNDTDLTKLLNTLKLRYKKIKIPMLQAMEGRRPRPVVRDRLRFT